MLVFGKVYVKAYCSLECDTWSCAQANDASYVGLLGNRIRVARCEAISINPTFTQGDAPECHSLYLRSLRSLSSLESFYTLLLTPPAGTSLTIDTQQETYTMGSLSRRACYKCGNVGHYAGLCRSSGISAEEANAHAEVCSSSERLCYNCKYMEAPSIRLNANTNSRQAAWCVP